MKVKRILGLILSLAMVLSLVPSVHADDEIKITYNGEIIETDTPPVIIDDRTLVPARAVFEKIGCEVYWLEEYRAVLVNKGMIEIQINIGNNDMFAKTYAPSSEDTEYYYHMEGLGFNLNTISLDVPAQIINDRTMIPVRAVAEAMDINVDWEDETRTVILTDKPAEPETTTEPELTPGPVVENPSFALKLKEQMPTDENYMVSPFSIKVALAMTANGGSGEAKQEILETLGIDNLDEFNEYVKKFIEETNTAKETNADSEAAEVANDNEYGIQGKRLPEFEIADSIWLNKDYYGNKAPKIAFAPEFEEIVSEYYDGAADVVDNENAVETINGWISDKTRGKINNVLDSPDFLAALVNTIYMKAQWVNQFGEYNTRKDTFTDRDGKESEIDFMHDTDHYSYYSDADTQMVRLPYNGGFSMYVVIGDSANFEAERELMESKKVNISLPKWKTESEFKLKGILGNMGIKTAFYRGFKDMFINEPTMDEVWIDEVIHKTYIDVDEEGTEAAAVTVVMMAGGSAMPMPEEIIEFKADKPFTYFICDDNNGEILFMGEYAYAE